MILEQYLQYAVDHKEFLIRLQSENRESTYQNDTKTKIRDMEKTTEYYKYLGYQTRLDDFGKRLSGEGAFGEENASLLLNTGVHFGVEVGIVSGTEDIFRHFYHRHQFIELVYVHKGRYHHFIDGKEEYLEEGELCLINPSCIHYDPLEWEEQIVYIGLPLSGLHASLLEDIDLRIRDFIEKSQDKDGRKEHICFRRKAGKSPDFYSYIESMARERFEKRAGSTHMLLALALRMLSVALEACEVEYISQSSKKIEHNFFCQIDDYCRKNLDRVSKQGIQDVFYFTGSQIDAIFRNELRTTFSRYLIRIRMERAGELIRRGAGSIEQVMGMVGYSNRTYFYRKFAEINGTSPGKLKKYKKGYKNLK